VQVENKIDNQVKGGFIPTSLAAHPDGSVVLALGERGLLQCFDIALSPVQLAFPNEEQLTGTILDIREVVLGLIEYIELFLIRVRITIYAKIAIFHEILVISTKKFAKNLNFLKIYFVRTKQNPISQTLKNTKTRENHRNESNKRNFRL
jgi:hypothetical protein